ncbi:MAG: transcription factor FapR [Halanaerobiales bacterium]
MIKLEKEERQKRLHDIINRNPFLTDKELAEKFNVSVQTIRLDRMELGIPEVRKRTKDFARSAYTRLKSVKEGEVIGELIKLKLDESAESILVTTEEMALQKTKIIRGHHIFGQANSLAVAVIDAEVVLTGSASIKYRNPVRVGERIRAVARVNNKKKRKYLVQVNTYREETVVFSGEFVMFARSEEEDLK